MRRLTNVLGLSLLLGACDVPGLEVEIDAPEAGPESAPPSEHDLRAAGQDPSELQVLCVLCLLGGNQAVCGVDNETYDNKCYATCHQVAVAHTGACSCGDGYVGPGEACDDGNAANNDACLATCNPASCGDGHVWVGHEACDDGNVSNTDACLASCQPASCGDGFVRAGVESCDDGNASSNDACPTNCQPASCGDGLVLSGVEDCDDGNASDDDGCIACAAAVCGDGHLRVGVEACDDGNTDDGDGCLSTCTTAQCGDGVVHDGVEACDDGNASDEDGCLSTCLVASCGDGFVQAGVEDCDDSNASDADGCLSTCEAATCGDGHVQAGVEACDDGNPSDADACLASCEVASCGDGHVQAGVEQCDDGDQDSDDACIACQPAACGDGFLQLGVEGCDDGNLADHDACRATCEPASCGDGVRWFGEEACDDGNTSDTDACRTDCNEATCGDGHVQNGVETCDDGDDDDDDGCPGNCQTAHCGDGFLQAGVEACDDGNSDPTDGCTDVCAPAVCGDGRVHAGVEQCDDGDLTSGDGCSSACKIEVCGDGIVDVGEDCDDGNTSDVDSCANDCSGQAVLQIASGRAHMCALLSGGRVKCWGNGLLSGSGDSTRHGDEPGEMGAALPFLDLGAGLSAVALDAEDSHTCALLADGRVKCWGANSVGGLGIGDAEDRGDDPNEMGDMLPFVDLGTGRVATAVSVGSFATCALLDGGVVKCWGFNDSGQLGLGNTQQRGDEPNEMGDGLPVVDLGPGRVATSVSIGESHACALLQDGTVKCWGSNEHGELGLGDTDTRGGGPGEMGDALPPVDLGPNVTATAITAGGQHTCALLANGDIKCWGLNNNGQLGLGDTAKRGDNPGEMGMMLPAVSLGGPAVAVSASSSHTCAVLAGGSVKCWGGLGLGLGDSVSRGDNPGEMGDSLPIVDLGAGQTALALTVSFLGSCARLQDDSVKCWGFNDAGQLGLGDTATRGDGPGEMGDSLPAVALGAGAQPISLAAGGRTTCVVLGDGSGKCWGQNNYGQLGLGDTANRGDNPGEMGDSLPRIKLFSSVW